MRKTGITLLLLLFLMVTNAWAVSSSIEVTCPADGSSIQVDPVRTGRTKITIVNSSDTDVRVGFIDSGIPDLDGTNSVTLKTNSSIQDNPPDTLTDRIVCMSTTGVAKVIGVIVKYRP